MSSFWVRGKEWWASGLQKSQENKGEGGHTSSERYYFSEVQLSPRNCSHQTPGRECQAPYLPSVRVSAQVWQSWTRWLLGSFAPILGSQPSPSGLQVRSREEGDLCITYAASLTWIKDGRSPRLMTPGPTCSKPPCSLGQPPSGFWGSSLLSPPSSPATTRGPEVTPALQQPGTVAAVLRSSSEVSPDSQLLDPPLVRDRES